MKCAILKPTVDLKMLLIKTEMDFEYFKYAKLFRQELNNNVPVLTTALLN